MKPADDSGEKITEGLDALKIWQGKEDHVLAAQRALYHRVRCNWAARRGEYNPAREETGAY